MQRLIGHCLIHRILPHVTKYHTKVPIPKLDDPFTSRYITVYRKGKSIGELTLNHIMFLEEVQEFPFGISEALSDDIDKFFERITAER